MQHSSKKVSSRWMGVLELKLPITGVPSSLPDLLLLGLNIGW